MMITKVCSKEHTLGTFKSQGIVFAHIPNVVSRGTMLGIYLLGKDWR